MKNHKKIAIIGIGNLLMGDDGIGIHVVKELVENRRMSIPQGVEIYDGMTDSFLVLEQMEGADKAIIIDACDMNAKDPPGSIKKFKFKFDKDKDEEDFDSFNLSLHDFDIFNALRISKHTHELPAEIIIVGVKPESIKYDMELSPRLEKAVPEIIKIIFEEI
ncbi:MAG: hydrogenase maturation protease [Halobacteriota archaeon]